MTFEERMELARAIVAGWPPLTDQQNRELTRINLRYRARLRDEQQAA
ncbi:hypothetical protein SEA_ITZA_51 [Streptomyces phage Itza]|nr:hypothetical protein SEA_ITZA_51 [Streptomyces phage Itza]